MCGIWSAKGIAGTVEEFLVHGGEVAFGQDAVAVEYEHIFALGVFDAIVACRSRAPVFLGHVLHVESVGIFVDDILAWSRRPVFDDDDLKVVNRLTGEAFEELVGFIRTVVYGYDD